MLAIAAVVVAITLAVVLLLVTGGGGGGGVDEEGDAHFVKGKQPRAAAGASIAAAVADISEASVADDGSRVVFEVTAAAPIPDEFERSSLEFRFDISEGGRKSWILSATVNVATTAALVSNSGDYSATTIDGRFPGKVEISKETLTVKLDPSRVETFPDEFEWALSSNLIAFRDMTGSTRAEDRFPNEGSVSFEP